MKNFVGLDQVKAKKVALTTIIKYPLHAYNNY